VWVLYGEACARGAVVGLMVDDVWQVTKRLVFSRVEKHFYKMQFEECQKMVNDAIRKMK
jgi:hypothetical protein